MTYEDANVLITGGLGFVGSNLAYKLVQLGAKVTLVDNLTPIYGGNPYNISHFSEEIVVSTADIRDPVAMRDLLKGQDYLFNLAAQTSHIGSMEEPLIDLEINTKAQLLTLEICRKINPSIKIIFTSTRQLYGKPDYLPVDERHPIRPVDVNGINKLAGEMYHSLYHDVYGIRTCTLRLTNTYGPAMRVQDANQTFLGLWFRLLIEGKTIQVFGDGLQLRDFNYVDDCVDALLLVGLSERANGRIYNLGSNEVVSLKTLAEKMTRLGSGSGFEIVPFPKDREAIDIGDYYSDFSQIASDLGWSPKIGLDEGLQKTIEYYHSYGKNYWDVVE